LSNESALFEKKSVLSFVALAMTESSSSLAIFLDIRFHPASLSTIKFSNSLALSSLFITTKDLLRVFFIIFGEIARETGVSVR
jgi:hypothetical protein